MKRCPFLFSLVCSAADIRSSFDSHSVPEREKNMKNQTIEQYFYSLMSSSTHGSYTYYYTRLANILLLPQFPSFSSLGSQHPDIQMLQHIV